MTNPTTTSYDIAQKLYSILSGGNPDYLRSHPTFEKDMNDAVSRMETMIFCSLD